MKAKLLDKVKASADFGKLKPQIGKRRWIVSGLVVSLIATIVLTFLYTTFRTDGIETENTEYEQQDKINTLTKITYVLYHDLYNKVNSTNADYYQIYLQPKEGYDDMFALESNEVLLTEADITTMAEPTEDVEVDLTDTTDIKTVSKTITELTEEEVLAMEEFYNHQGVMTDYFNGLESTFEYVNSTYDYWIEDLESGAYVSNISQEVKNYYEKGNVYFRLKILYDANGNATVEDATGLDYSQIRKDATVALRDNSLYHVFEYYGVENNNSKYYSVAMPKNCRVTYYVSTEAYSDFVEQTSKGFADSSAMDAFFLAAVIVFILGIIWPWNKEYKPWEQYKILRMPLEGLFFVFFVWLGVVTESVASRAYEVAYAYEYRLNGMYFSWIYEHFLNFLLLMILFLTTWYFGVCARSALDMGVKQYCKKRLACFDFVCYCKEKVVQAYDNIMHFDVTSNSKKMIFKIVLINAVVLFVISSLWFGGFAITVIYSVILYFVLNKIVSDVQQKYKILLNATNEMAEGNLDVHIDKDMGIFEPFRPQMQRIQSGFKNAVEQEVKSQKMKAELITNVSHDLKTPLTAIITYISLLQNENITEEQRKEYLDTLERKSLRLKVLIEDLFEVSKANSQNMKLELVNVDLMNLIKQVSYEMSDKMQASKLDVRLNLPDEKVLTMLDSQKTYRIYENLFGNIAKYAMAGTRVYITGTITDDSIIITLKNITAEELHVSAEDLTERFVRGDASRNTEGSGLGLAIAKSFTELQGGKFFIELDDDIFKVTTIFKLNNE